MTTELVHAQQNQPAPVPAASGTHASNLIQTTAMDLDAAIRIARALVMTNFAPSHFKGKPEEGAAAILYGALIELNPLAALQNIHVISGRPGLYARTMVGLILAKGHEVWTEVDTPEKVVVCGRRRGSDKVERSEWTIDRARRAGYLSNKKYETDPQAMLYARASGDIARKVAPDVLLGMAYNVEELELEPGLNQAADIPAAAPVSAAEITGQVEPEPESRTSGPVTAADITGSNEPQDDPETPAEPGQQHARPMTEAQKRKIFSLYKEIGVQNRDNRLKSMSDYLGRDITTSSELSLDEAKMLIDWLEGVAVQAKAGQS